MPSVSSVCSVLPMCETHTYVRVAGCSYSPDLHTENNTEARTYTNTYSIHVPVNGSLLSQSALVFFLGWGRIMSGERLRMPVFVPCYSVLS